MLTNLDVCYKPAQEISEEMLQKRKDCMANYDNTVGLSPVITPSSLDPYDSCSLSFHLVSPSSPPLLLPSALLRSPSLSPLPISCTFVFFKGIAYRPSPTTPSTSTQQEPESTVNSLQTSKTNLGSCLFCLTGPSSWLGLWLIKPFCYFRCCVALL